VAEPHPLIRPTRAATLAVIAAGLAALAAGSESARDPLPPWIPDSAQLERLARGEVVVIADIEASRPEVEVAAAVQIAASPQRIFRTMTDCAQALEFVPHLEVCRVLESAPDGSWQIIEHGVDLSWYLPRMDYVFRAEYEPFRRIRFSHVRGDLRENRGTWELHPADEGETIATILTYRVHVEPRSFMPRWIVRSSLRRDLPRMLRALRERCEEGLTADG
jgi:ribosome-associated toxin RatA of RatAB toxin-antitoxin module